MESDNQKEIVKKPTSLVTNTISNLLALGVHIIIVFLLTPIIINYIGKVGYGVWAIVVSVVGYYGLFDLGIRSAITRFISKNIGMNNSEGINKSFSTSMYLFCIIGVILSFLSFFIADSLAHFLKISEENITDFKYLIWIMGIATGLSFPTNIYSSNLAAHELFVKQNIVKIIVVLMRFFGTIAVLFTGFGIVGVAVGYLISYIFDFVINIFLFKKLTPHVRLKLKYFELDTLKKIIRYGIKSFILILTNQIRFNLDSIVIAKVLSIPLVAIYRIASLIVRYLLGSILSITAVLIPRFSILYGKKDLNELKNLFLKSLAVTSIISFGICMIGFIFGGQFISIWVGKDFFEAVPLLWILLCAYVFELAQNAGVGILFALNKHKFYAIVSIIEGICNVILSVILAPQFGIIGVALGTAIPMLIVKIIIQPFYVCKVIKVSLPAYILRIIIPFVISSMAIIISWQSGVLFQWEDFSIPMSILFGIIYSVCFAVIVIFLFSIIKVKVFDKLKIPFMKG